MRTIWNKLISRRVELVFAGLVLTLACVYLLQPQRGAAVQEVWGHVRRIAGQLAQPSRVWVAPPDLDRFSGDGLARFGESLQFLGCDVAITQDGQGTHVWRLTLWRALQPLPTDYVLEMAIVPADGSAPLTEEHRLGQQFLAPEWPASAWPPGQVVIDATLLPAELDPGVDCQQRIRLRAAGEPQSWLPADTAFLEQDALGWLAVCE